MELKQYYNYLIDTDIVSEDSLQLITRINGYNEKTLDDVLYCTTGYRNIEQYLYYEDKETFKEYYSQDNEWLKIMESKLEVRKMEDKEYIKYLKERNEKLIQLESMIVNLQKNANDVPERDRLSHDDLKMEVFRLWYFANYGKKYNL